MKPNNINQGVTASNGVSGGANPLADMSAFDITQVEPANPNGVTNPASEVTTDGNQPPLVPELPGDQQQRQTDRQLQPYEHLIDGNVVTIEERYRDLDPVTAIYRQNKSKYDVLDNNFQQLQTENTTLQKAEEFLSIIMNDESALKAFVVEKYPDLFPKIDPEVQIKMKMDEEFGADFQFNRDEADGNPFSQSAKFLMRLNELRSKAQETSMPKKLKEIIEERQTATDQELQKKANTLNQFKVKNNLDEPKFEHFTQWVNAVVADLDSLYKMYAFAHRANPNSPTSLTNLNGTQTRKSTQQKLKEIFG